MTVAGEIWIKLGLDATNLESGLGMAKGSLTSWRDETNKSTMEVAKWGAAIAAEVAPLVLVAREMEKAAVAAGKYGDHLHDLSLTTLMTERNLQRLSYAVNASGGDFETLAGSISYLGKNLQNARDPTSRQAEAFKELGIHAVDSNGKVRDMDRLLPQIVDKLHNMRDKTKAANLEMELFGRNTGEVAKMVELGSAGINAYADSAERMGLAFSPDQLAMQQEFNAQWSEMNTQINLLYTQLGTALIPALSEVSSMVSGSIPVISAMVVELQLVANAYLAAAEAAMAWASLGSLDTEASEAHGTASQAALSRAAGNLETLGNYGSTTTSTSKSKLSPSKTLYYSRHPELTPPAMASGGIVTEPTLALIGEAGPEAVIPLNKSGGVGGRVVQNNYYTTIAFTAAQIKSLNAQSARSLANQINSRGSI
jgi:hypothetical protein